jgi:hypothetical protein
VSARKTPIRLAALVLLSSLLAAVLVSSAFGAKHKVYFPSKCTNARYKPSHVVAACADNGLVVNGIQWSHWGQKSAAGSGTAVTNTCHPNCAAGHFRNDPAKVNLFRPRLCSALGIKLFTRLKITYPTSRPPGSNKAITFPFPCSLLQGGSG